MHRVLIVSESEVESLLTMQECIGVMESALASLARGEVHQPLRHAKRAPGAQGLLGLMPSYASPRASGLGPRVDASEGGGSYYVLKEFWVFPGNPARGLDTHFGAVLL